MKFVEFALYNGGGTFAVNVDHVTHLTADEESGTTQILVTGTTNVYETNRPIDEVVKILNEAASNTE